MHAPGYDTHQSMLSRLATGGGRKADRSYEAHRDDLLRAALPRALFVAAGVTALQAVADIVNHRELLAQRPAIYGALIAITTSAGLLSRTQALRERVALIALVADIAFTVLIISFIAVPGTAEAGIAINLSLKLLATAILFPWPPALQHLSGSYSLFFYWTVISMSPLQPVHTFQLVTPLLAAILGSVGAAHIDRTRRALFQHAVDLESSQHQLSKALDTERHLLTIARQTAMLGDIPSVLSRLNQAVAAALDCEFAVIFLEDDLAVDALRPTSTYLAKPDPSQTDADIRNWSQTAIAKHLAQHDSIVINDIDDQPFIPPGELHRRGVKSLAMTQITASGTFMGLIIAGRLDDETPLTTDQARLLSGAAVHAAAAIRNAQLFQERARSEAAYRDLFERANDLIFVADERGGLHFANKAALDFFGLSAEQLPETQWTAFLDSEQQTLINRRMRIARRRNIDLAQSFEVSAMKAGGGSATLELRLRKISPPGNMPRHYQCIARDATERRKREEEAQALLARLQESSRLQDEFVANMSHELRTPLNVIIGYADLIADERSLPINSDARSFLQRINSASRALHRMVESILEYARLDRGRMVMIPTHFSSEHLLLELRGLCNDVRGSLEVGVTITQVDAIEFVTDYDRLFSVLSNLLLNALKFTPRGNVLLELRQCGGCAEFTIRDTGIGIDPCELHNVFEPFRQVDGSNTRAFGGVGLGLAIVRRNVDLLQGSVDVESKLEIGTTFHLTIPTRLEEDDESHGRVRGAA
jgi:PAS domain S-box-containing protein